MSASQGHFKYKSNGKGEWKKASVNITSAGDESKLSLLSVYDVRLRPPYADIVRYKSSDYNDKDGDWAKYRRRHHLAPITTFTYDMTQTSEERTHDFCFDACHGFYVEPITAHNTTPPTASASYTEMACFMMIPGCSVHAKTFYNVTQNSVIPGTDKDTLEEVANLQIDDECVKPLKRFGKTGENTNNSWMWSIVGLWIFIFLGNLFLRYSENTLCSIKLTSAILFVASIAVVVMTAWYAHDIDRLVHVKHPLSHENKTEFFTPNCYASYYVNTLGYTQEINNKTSFKISSNFFNKDTLKPTHAYKQPFRRGPRHWYMIFAALVGFVHVLVYGLIGVTVKKGEGLTSTFNSMHHLSSTLF